MIPDILYEDNHIIVANKPAGVLSQADASGRESMLEILRRYVKEKYCRPGNVFMGLVHRLDMPVSGVMVFAKTSKAAGRLFTEITSGSMKKFYIAIIEKRLDADGKWHKLENSLYREKDITRISPDGGKNTLKAVLYFRTLTNYGNKSLVLVKLGTGKKHQIRAQFASVNAPVSGDKKYGSRENSGAILLHAVFISFIHPTLRERMDFYSGIPERFRTALSCDPEEIKQQVLSLTAEPDVIP